MLFCSYHEHVNIAQTLHYNNYNLDEDDQDNDAEDIQ